MATEGTAHSRLAEEVAFHQECYEKYIHIPNGPDHKSKMGWTDEEAAEYHRQRVTDLCEVLGIERPKNGR